MGEEELDDVGTSSSAGNASRRSSSSRKGRQKHRELLVPRGLDLLPSMRAPRRLPLPIAATSKGNSSGGSGGGGTAEDVAQKAAGTKEYVPWIGGSGNLGGASKAEVTGKAPEAPAGAAGAAGAAVGAAGAPARADNAIEDRVQWFPRGLPREVTVAGRSQDERESAIYNTRVSVAIDRLGEHVSDTTKRQADMEVKRRAKVCTA